jgi:hypothetical protein
LTKKGIAFAATQKGKTGAFMGLSCYYSGGSPNTPVPVLEPFAPGGSSNAFLVTGVSCQGDIHIVAQHPAIAGLNDSDLANWSCSVHEAFTVWPKATFIPLAIALDGPPTFTAADGSKGSPYILAKGKGLVAIGGCTGFAALAESLAINPGIKRSLSREMSVIERTLNRKNRNGAFTNCAILRRRLLALVKRGIIDLNTADGLFGCCSSIGATSPSGAGSGGGGGGGKT